MLTLSCHAPVWNEAATTNLFCAVLIILCSTWQYWTFVLFGLSFVFKWLVLINGAFYYWIDQI